MNRRFAFGLIATLIIAGGLLSSWLHLFSARTSISIFFGGAGAGTVTVAGSTPCSSDCVEGSYYEGTKITLTAMPAAGSLFAGWAGTVCQGTQATCDATLGQTNRVIAYFRSSFKTVAAGAYHTCVLRPAGDIVCWGKNSNGQLGSGTDSPSEAPVPVKFITNAVAIAAGGFHTCALLSDGTVQCWGNNQYGQATGSSLDGNSNAPFPTGFRNVIGLAAGGYHTCAVHAGGTASCWGLNADGQLGDGTTDTPQVSLVTRTVQLGGVGPLSRVIAAGGFHTCAILATDSTVACWGMNKDGQLGRGPTAAAQEPTPGATVQLKLPVCTAGFLEGCADPANPGITLLKAKAIAASIGIGQIPGGVFGGFHTAALDTSGFDWGWGFNNDGEASPNSAGSQNAAVPGVISPPPTIFPTKIAAGAYHTCIASRADGVFCRGHNVNGESGPMPNTSKKTDAVPMTIGTVDLAAGGYHTCAIVVGITPDPAGSVVCWGENGDGQVTGNPTTSNVTTPSVLSAP